MLILEKKKMPDPEISITVNEIIEWIHSWHENT